MNSGRRHERSRSKTACRVAWSRRFMKISVAPCGRQRRSAWPALSANGLSRCQSFRGPRRPPIRFAPSHRRRTVRCGCATRAAVSSDGKTASWKAWGAWSDNGSRTPSIRTAPIASGSASGKVAYRSSIRDASRPTLPNRDCPQVRSTSCSKTGLAGSGWQRIMRSAESRANGSARLPPTGCRNRASCPWLKIRQVISGLG